MIEEIILVDKNDQPVGKWTNTCCSHPRFGELTTDAAKKRLKEEMGIECKLHPVFSFSYRTEFENGLIENEYDHVYLGVSDALAQPDPSEVADFKYIKMEELQSSLVQQHEKYAEWLKIYFDQVMAHYTKKQSNG